MGGGQTLGVQDDANQQMRVVPSSLDLLPPCDYISPLILTKLLRKSSYYDKSHLSRLYCVALMKRSVVVDAALSPPSLSPGQGGGS